MLPKNNASRIRTKLLIKIAETFLNDDVNKIDRLPLDLRPKDEHHNRCCIYKDRAILKYRTMAALGHSIEDETDELKPLSAYAKEALARERDDKPVLTVIDIACSGCIKAQYMVTNACRGCLAQPCRLNCPKDCITIVDGQAKIDANACVNCGKCKEVCPYHAIIHVPIPCEEACPVDAISKDESGKEVIDHDKCVNCGKCLVSCPFGAIVETSQIIDVIRNIKDQNKKLVAMLAPAVVGQFPGTIKNLAAALKQFGFDKVVEVASGADTTIIKEAEEFIEKMEEGHDFMTTSCCPAYVNAVNKHIPELKPFVSSTETPMYYTAEMVKKEDPEATTIFIGPCLAKRVESQKYDVVDFVLTFEEIGALLVAKDIMVAECYEIEFDTLEEASAQGRGFPITGGVAGAVAHRVGDKAEVKPEKIDGLDAASMKKLKRFANKGCPGCNIVEVMCCEGGCVAGPRTLALPKKSTRQVEKYVTDSDDIK